ncbi:phosphofurin acidic cluster sorting protein 1 isoform X3 [Daktulosphaira vitifoliae]|uniref:phosphofurin acidic cluster sorting protein 1 isoform X3 n=1 Tax=Daktulosphaira vitifoliae TaxID=58002 RepID=UPI0021AAC9DD|nr:phosphofurin acidic cluster sorting protein 1 isoform X3 [Daktulosphaira vitifoliae]
MAEKCVKTPLATPRPVPMKLFATWEVDRTPSNCVPSFKHCSRVCSMNLTKLVLTKPLGQEMSALTIAVKMQGSKRTLRTNELPLTANGLLEIELQLNFCLQYPHFLKRDVNKLHVMLQRRKKYKNRTILGFKTLAEGVINMSLVLQRPLDLELELLGDPKDPKSLVGRVYIVCLNSQPVDHEGVTKAVTGRGNEYSDEDEEFSSGEDASDSDPTLEERRRKKTINTGNARQRNLKQKFIALLKRFRVNEDLHSLENDRETISQKLSGGDMDPADIEDLLEELEDQSDSGPDLDTLSILSTPKPSLRPFFSSSRTNMIHEGLSGLPSMERNIERFSDESSKKADSDSYLDTWTDSDPTPMNSSPPKTMNIGDEKKDVTPNTVEKEKKSRIFTRDRTSSSNKFKRSPMPKPTVSDNDHNRSVNTSGSGSSSGSAVPDNIGSMVEPRKVLMEQLSKVLPPEDKMPEVLCLIHYSDPLGGQLASKLQNYNFKVITPAGLADVRAAFMCIINKIQKYCNSNPKPPSQMKILLAGSDSFVNYVLRQYVEQLSFKPPDWINFIKFYIIPLGINTLSRYLGTVDSYYGSTFLFKEDYWKEQLECGDGLDIISKIKNYLMEASNTIQFQIAEAMLSYKEKSSDDEASQIFIPFVNDVRICMGEMLLCSNDDEQPPSILDRKSIIDKTTPPNSPNIGMQFIPPHTKQVNWETCESLELQVDYWLVPNSNKEVPARNNEPTNKRMDTKFTLKNGFKSLHISRLFLNNDESLAFLTVSYIKEKKQKIMRLGKKKEKEKDLEPKNQVIDSVLRLICSPKTQNYPLTISIDGYEWSGVKFFQLSSQWQTHIKYFPVAVYSLDYQPRSLPHLNHPI